MSGKLEKLYEELSSLSVLEVAELSKMLEDKWGVTASVAVAAAPAAGAAVVQEEQIRKHLLDPTDCLTADEFRKEIDKW